MTRLSLGEDVRFYDIELLKVAKDYRLETYSLEPIEREAEALNSFAMEAQVEALLHSLNNFKTQKAEYIKLESAFSRGDIDKVFEYTVHPFENNADFINEFYTRRNQEWLPKIESMMKEQKSFITVGIAHLEGDNGLLALLRSKGFTVSPININ
jgi:hypothetical protein